MDQSDTPADNDCRVNASLSEIYLEFDQNIDTLVLTPEQARLLIMALTEALEAQERMQKYYREIQNTEQH